MSVIYLVIIHLRGTEGFKEYTRGIQKILKQILKKKTLNMVTK